MKVQELTQILIDELKKSSKAVLPNIGIFLIEDVPSKFSNDGKSISAPTKRLIFNDIYKRNSKEAEIATKLVSEQMCDEIVSQLKKEGNVELPGLGVLKMEEANNNSAAKISFIVDNEFVADPDAYGLEDIHLEEEMATEVLAATEAEEQEKAEATSEAKLESMQQAEEKLQAKQEAKAEEKPEDKLESMQQAQAEAKPEAKKETKPSGKPETKPLKPQQNESPRKGVENSTKVILWIVGAIVLLVILALLIYIFRESLAPYLKDILYSKEELEILNYKL